MIDAWLTIIAILATVVVSGAVVGSQRTQPTGTNRISWQIIAGSTIAGVTLAGIVFWGGVQAWLCHHRWAGVHNTLFVIEAFSSLAMGSSCGWLVACLLSRRSHRQWNKQI